MKKEMWFRFSMRRQSKKDNVPEERKNVQEDIENSTEKKALDALWRQAVWYIDGGRFDEAKLIFQQIKGIIKILRSLVPAILRWGN